MANDYFKTALTRAGLSVEEFADITRVDPKTVQRWVSGRTPYPRHRATISRALDVPEHELWPETVAAPTSVTTGTPAPVPAVGDVVGVWSDPAADGAPDPVVFLTGQIDAVDLLDPDGSLLQAPGVQGALRALAAAGANVRIITRSVPVEPVGTERERVEVRSPALSTPSLIVLRADAAMLLVLALHDRHAPPLLTLRDGGDGLFDRLVQAFDRAWDAGAPHESAADVVNAITTGEPPAPTQEPPRRWPGRRA